MKRCFLAFPYDFKFRKVIDCTVSALKSEGYRVSNSPREAPGFTDSHRYAHSEIANADLVVADISGNYPNTWIEIGLAQAMSKPLLTIKSVEDRYRKPTNLEDFVTVDYHVEDLKRLHDSLRRAVHEVKFLGAGASMNIGMPAALPFFVDWDRISESEAENLCQELLAQMGYRRVQWGRSSKEIDLIAEYPRKDPDGYEYSELWLVSMGLRTPTYTMFDMALEDPEYFIDRTLRYSSNSESRLHRSSFNNITLLVIAAGRRAEKEFDFIQERFEKRFRSRKFGRSMLRLRMWDREYLTALVQRNPNIAFKYFSDEGRARSKTRKSFEELYQENVVLLDEQQRLNVEIKIERDKRVRAERDSVWRDISFSAAHKIGNPIFAIETALKPLNRRISEGRSAEGLEITESISRSVDRAKGYVEQFKSLAKAQNVVPVQGALRPVLLDAQLGIKDQGIQCTVTCHNGTEVFADFDRLNECFDELATNAVRWLNVSDRSPKKRKVQIVADPNGDAPLPDFLDQSVTYTVVNFRDNGMGVPVAKKEEIFKPFVTEYEHGTGLGLALIRRILEGHGGAILEVGKPGVGADFEMYIPDKKR